MRIEEEAHSTVPVLRRRLFLRVVASLAGASALALVGCGAAGATSTDTGTAGSAVGSGASTGASCHGDVVVNDAAASDEGASALTAASFPRLVACAGDSITYGYGVEGTRDADSYPARLSALLAEAGGQTRVENFGLCGACALSSGKNPYTDFAKYYASLDAGADVVVLMLGTNDAASVYWDRATFERELAERVGAYQQTEESPRVLLMVPPDILSPDWAGGVPAATVDEMQEAVRAVAAEQGLACVDLEPLFAGRDDLLADGVHPNAAGNALIARAVFEALTSP